MRNGSLLTFSLAAFIVLVVAGAFLLLGVGPFESIGLAVIVISAVLTVVAFIRAMH